MHRILPILLLGVTINGTFAQGPITPPIASDPSIGPVNALTPGGSPQATMKTLHQVEPRTAIPGGTATVTLAQRGAYYLTGDIVVSAGDGIVITASHVTLDLNGFSVLSSAAPADGTGIVLADALRNVTIRNGSIGPDGAGSFLAGVRYVASGFPQPPQNARVTDLSVNAADYGIDVGGTSQIERCMVSGGSQVGIAGTIVRGCVSSGGRIAASVASQCVVNTSGTQGLSATVVENCVATSQGSAIDGRCVTNSYAMGGGDSDVLSAGVALNVWAEGGSGTGDAMEATVVGNSYARRSSDLSGPSQGAGIRATVVHASEGRADYAAGIDGAVTTASRGRSSFNLGISSDDSLVAYSFGSGVWGIRADDGAITGSLGKGNESGILAADGLVTASHGRGISDAGIWAFGGHVTQSFGWADTFSNPGLRAGSAIGSRTKGGQAFAANIQDLAQGVYGTSGVAAPLKFDSN